MAQGQQQADDGEWEAQPGGGRAPQYPFHEIKTVREQRAAVYEPVSASGHQWRVYEYFLCEPAGGQLLCGKAAGGARWGGAAEERVLLHRALQLYPVRCGPGGQKTGDVHL